MIETTEKGVILSVFVQPKASKTEFIGVHGDALKFRLAASPVEGAANVALCEYLAKLFSVSKSSVEILAGKSSRRKRVELSGVTLSVVKEILKIK